MKLVFTISRDNGMTWSAPININTTNFANRGYPSMVLDEVKGHLVFGWYDGRRDKSFESVEYFGAVINAKTLDKLVQEIPLSNPLFIVPADDDALPVTTAGTKVLNNRLKRTSKKHG
jgi:hypothetical protein